VQSPVVMGDKIRTIGAFDHPGRPSTCRQDTGTARLITMRAASASACSFRFWRWCCFGNAGRAQTEALSEYRGVEPGTFQLRRCASP
jgi:hypothetical protein